ncbi:hypothetical protein D555_3559 [Bordetella holmesii 35009]|nr:hypothetical protein D555_3559 [Bordetella holmesii 35009]
MFQAFVDDARGLGNGLAAFGDATCLEMKPGLGDRGARAAIQQSNEALGAALKTSVSRPMS